MATAKDYLKLLDASKVHNSVFDRKFMYLSDIVHKTKRHIAASFS